MYILFSIKFAGMIFIILMWFWFPMPRLKNGSAWASLIRFATTWSTTAMSWRPRMPLRSVSGTVSHRSNTVDFFFGMATHADSMDLQWSVSLFQWWTWQLSWLVKVIPIVWQINHMFAWFIDLCSGNYWIAMSGHGVWDMLTTPFPIDPEAAWMTSRSGPCNLYILYKNNIRKLCDEYTCI